MASSLHLRITYMSIIVIMWVPATKLPISHKLSFSPLSADYVVCTNTQAQMHPPQVSLTSLEISDSWILVWTHFKCVRMSKSFDRSVHSLSVYLQISLC